MSKNLPSSHRATLKFLRVTRGGRDYKIFQKDIRTYIKFVKRSRPPVPAF